MQTERLAEARTNYRVDSLSLDLLYRSRSQQQIYRWRQHHVKSVSEGPHITRDNDSSKRPVTPALRRVKTTMASERAKTKRSATL